MGSGMNLDLETAEGAEEAGLHHVAFNSAAALCLALLAGHSVSPSGMGKLLKLGGSDPPRCVWQPLRELLRCGKLLLK